MGLLGSLFGKSAKGYNKAAPWINETFQPAAKAGLGGLTQLSSELGGGFDSYKEHSGYNFGLDEGMDGITGNAAAHGLLRSGSTGKALERYGADYFKNRYYDDYLGNLGSLAGLGLGAGGLVANANQVNRGQSDGILGKIGQAAGTAAMLFSDRRLKTGISRIGTLEDGLGLYSYRYRWEDTPREGVMADEVAELRPWALGPVVEGYATVDYSRLGAL